MPNWNAWLQGPSGVIEVEVKLLLREFTLIKVENVSWKQISITNLNHYQILGYVKIPRKKYARCLWC
jgi:hypothetical protein